MTTLRGTTTLWALASVWISCRAAFAADDPVSLRVMSFNIRYGTADDGENDWERRRDLLVDTITAFGPDLLGTQETLAFQADDLAARLGDYAVVAAGRDDGRTEGEMTAVLYRTARFQLIDCGHFWLSETPGEPGSRSWDAAITRMVTWLQLRDRKATGQPPIYWFNTHFDHLGQEARAQSASLQHDRITGLENEAAAIVTGDFNAGEDSRPYRTLFGSHRLQDSYRVAHPRRGSAEGTFNGFDPQARDGDRIDWIGCTGRFTVLDAGIDRTTRDGRTPSDHFPVTANLEYRPLARGTPP